MAVQADAKVLIFAVDLCLINFLPLPLCYPRKNIFLVGWTMLAYCVKWQTICTPPVMMLTKEQSETDV